MKNIKFLINRLKHTVKLKLISISMMVRNLAVDVFCMFSYVYYGKNIILFESHGVYGGNSGAIYNYLRSNRKYDNYTCVWIVLNYKEGKIRNTRRDLVFPYEKFTVRKAALMRMAMLAFYDNGAIKAGGKNAKVVYLTHGQPTLKESKGLITVPDYVTDALCISNNYLKRYCELLNISPDRVFICGMPRNDVLFSGNNMINNILGMKKYNKVILWLPTFRKIQGFDRYDSDNSLPFGIPFFYTIDELGILNENLKLFNSLLIIKFHPMQDLREISTSDLTNIIFLSHKMISDKNIETNMLFPFTDALITDYSSVAFDYLLTDKPLAYAIDDEEEYKYTLTKEEYDSITPGDKIHSKEELIVFISKVFNEEDNYKDARRYLRDYYHCFQDGENCKRIVEKFLENK